jgi:predicted DNA-binding transcriptional regulator AlpA
MGQFENKIVLTLPEICAASGYAQQTAYYEISMGIFPIRIRKQCKKWIADIRDVADWLDYQRDLANS